MSAVSRIRCFFVAPSLRRCAWTIVLLSSCSVAQTLPGTRPTSPAATDGSSKPEARKPKLTAQQEQGLRLLKATEAGAAGLESDMRAFVLWRASYAYSALDPKKAESLAKDSFVASQAIEDPSDRDQCGPIGGAGVIKSWIQARVLSEMIQKKERIAEAEELLPSATPPVRNDITTQLIQHYVAEKNLARAEVLLSQLADSEPYPFQAAADLLLAMGSEQSADQMTVFNQALNNFEQHGTANGIGQEDLGTFIERTWTHLPSSVVLEAIDKMLDEAKSKDSHSHLSIASDKGSVSLNSTYELRLFQLLPILDELDKGRAEHLLNDNREVQAQLVKYPKGMDSLTSEGHIYSYGITDDDSPHAAESASRHEAMAQLMQREQEIGKEAEKDPAQALAQALTLPLEDLARSYSPRADVLLTIAHNTTKKKPSLAKSALDEILKFEDQLNPKEIRKLADVPKVYSELGDEDTAKKALKVVLKAAESLYAHDTDAEDPNKSFKGTWPSTDLWRQCVQIAAKISPALAEEIISAISDPEIAASQKVSFASSLLGATSAPVLVGDCRKSESSYGFSN